MTLRLIPLVAVVAILELPLADAFDSARPDPTTPSAVGDSYDLLYLADVRPVVVRFRFIADGKPIENAWNRFVDALFAKLDADKNGSIDGKELTQLGPILTLLTGQSHHTPAQSGTVGELNREKFAAYLRNSNLGPFRLPTPKEGPALRSTRRVQAGSTASPEELNQALLDLLDSNKDGKLSVDELAAAPAILAALDTDENEFITTDELLRRPPAPPFFVTVSESSPRGSVMDFVHLSRKGADANLARLLLTRYGAKPAGGLPTAPMPKPKAGSGALPTETRVPSSRRLTRKDLGLSADTFAALDQDGDGELDAEELARFGSGCSPEVEILLRMAMPGTKTGRPAEIVTPGQPPVTAMMAGGVVALEVPGVRLDLIPPTGGTRALPLLTYYISVFRQLDRDGNGYIDMTEAEMNPTFRELFSLLDRDGDGKVYLKEMTATLNELDVIATAASRGIILMEVTGLGRGLFDLFDANGDGRLSLREIRALPKLVKQFDKNQDGAISLNEVPRRFQATLSQGLTLIGTRSLIQPPVKMVGQGARPQAIGPLWFQKMDRNRDGDVSRREFLGTDEDFRRLDLDGDGLIDAHEAEAAGNNGATRAPAPKLVSDK